MYHLCTACAYPFVFEVLELFNKRIQLLKESDSFAQGWLTCYLFFIPSFVKGYTLLETYGNDEDNLCEEAS